MCITRCVGSWNDSWLQGHPPFLFPVSLVVALTLYTPLSQILCCCLCADTSQHVLRLTCATVSLSTGIRSIQNSAFGLIQYLLLDAPPERTVENCFDTVAFSNALRDPTFGVRTIATTPQNFRPCVLHKRPLLCLPMGALV